MAAYGLTFSVKDEKGKESTVTYWLPDTFSVVNIQGFTTLIAPLLNTLIDGALTRAALTIGLTLPGGIKTVPNPGADVEEGGLFMYRTTGGYPTRQRIPTMKEQYIVAGSNLVDTADADVAAYVSAMTAGLDASGTQVEPSDNRGESIALLSDAFEDFKRSRRRG